MSNINFQISKSAARYHFTISLSGTNPVMGTAYQEHLLEIVGALTPLEQEAIFEFEKWFKKICLEDELESKRILKEFFSNKNYDEIIRSLEMHPVLIETLKLFEAKFEKYWHKCEPILNKNKLILEANFSDVQDRLDSTFDKLLYFYNDFQQEKLANLTICLLYSPIENMAGRYIDLDKVSIDTPIIDSENTYKFWLLFIHEAIHAHFENNNYKQWLRSFANKQKQTPLSSQMGPKNLLRELIVCSFASNGILAESIYPIDIRQNLKKEITEFKNDGTKRQQFNLLKKITALEMYSTNKEYLKNKKKIDESYLEKVWEIIYRNR